MSGELIAVNSPREEPLGNGGPTEKQSGPVGEGDGDW